MPPVIAEAASADARSDVPALDGLRRAGRRGVRKLAEALMPTSLVVWRGKGAGSIGHGPRVALTFDDGPDAMTPEYLAVLSELGVRATFFLVGRQCARHPELVKQIAAEGHEVGAHGYTHRRFPSLGARELEEELWKTRNLLPASPGKKPLLRPPHGAISVRSLLTCARAGFTTVLWSHDSGDSRTERSEDVARAFEPGSPHAGDIVLMHEGQPWTIDALPRVVGGLKERGHALVSVGELLHG
jgi:peptidoglycan/xylan/chitin deacetylase (PgdA/CDA1 family)